MSQDTPTSASRSVLTDLTTIDLASIVVRRWRWIIGLPLGFAVLAAIGSLLMRPTFTAVTTFVPEANPSAGLPAGLASVAGIAGQFGISLGSDVTRSPRFYADVVKSRELMERALLSPLPDPRSRAPQDSVRLLNLLDVRGKTFADSLARGVQSLRNLVGAQVDVQTGIVRVSVNSRYPDVAATTANRLIDYLNEFNTQKRQSQARERRKFVEQRLSDAEKDLRSSEGDLRAFLERNRSWQQSPQLVFEQGRLQRQMDIRQQVYLTLRREYETARIEEVNDAPVITVIDPGVVPTIRARPRRKVMVAIGLVLGLLLGGVIAFAADYLERARSENSEQYRRLTTGLATARRDLARFVRRSSS